MVQTTCHANTDIQINSLGDSAIIIYFGNEIEISIHKRVKALLDYLDKEPIEGMIEYVPSYTSVTIYYNPLQVLQKNKKGSPSEIISFQLEEIVKNLKNSNEQVARKIEIPVCYGGGFGPDLEYVAKHNNLTTDEVISIHSSKEYLVYMLGFAPGFPFVGGMSKQIATPRRKEPRSAIPAGSVGIAGNQTGIYPISTPGGWQLIGRTPVRLFLSEQNPPSFLQAGDIIKFKSISLKEFNEYKEETS